MKMLRLDNIKRFAAVLIAAGVSFVSCVEMSEPQNDEVGYLTAPMLDVDVTVQDIAQTKASKPVVEAPSVSDIHFVVKDKDGNVVYDAYGLWTDALVLPVGAYTVEATYGSNSFGTPYFTDTASGNIDPLDSEVPVLSLSLANSLVCVELDSEFAKHFDVGSSKAILKSDSASAEVEYGQWIYVPSGADLEVAMTGITAGESVSLIHKLSSPSPKVAYNLVCKKSSTSWPEIKWTSASLAEGAFEGGLYFLPAVPSNMSDANKASLTYQVKGGTYSDWTEVSVSDVSGYKYISGLSNDETYSLRACVGNIISEELSFTPVSFQNCFSMGAVTAAHNNAGNTNLELSSTTMTAGSMKVTLPAIVEKMASVTVEGDFSSSNNEATGNFSSVALTSTAKNVDFLNNENWPYLPKGTYSSTVIAACTLNGATYTATADQKVTVPAPEFNVLLSAYTSYDKAMGINGHSKDINAANECNPTTLYNAGAQWGISTGIMSNGNYEKTLVIKIDDDASRTFKVTGEYSDNKYHDDIPDLSWASHSLTVSVTFDGTTVEKSQTHHITGLPYTLTHPAQGWTIVENGAVTYTYFGDSYIFLTSDSSTGSVKTPDFHIPADTDISVSTTFKRIRDGIVFDWTFSVHTYDSSGNTSEIASDTGNGKNTTHTIGGNAKFSTSCYNILCRRYYFGGSGPDAQISDFTIRYR